MTRPQAIATARRMYANGEGWTNKEIRDYLTSHGHDVHYTTIRAWVDEDYAKERNRQRRERMRRFSRDKRGTTQFLVLDADARRRLGLDVPHEPPAELTPELLLALRLEDGLPYSAIAKVARRFFGERDATEDKVRFRLYELGAPKNPNKARAHERGAA